MKKFQVLIAIALLAVAGTGFAVTCAYDNVPGATLLVPHFKVARNGSTGGDIPAGGADTLVAVTNVSSVGVIAHVTVWNKYSRAVLDFNVPMSGYDVAFFSMRDILNGKLNVNTKYQPWRELQSDGTYRNRDVCKTAVSSSNPLTGFAKQTFQRFTNPDATDRDRSISYYSVPAFSGSFRTAVWASLDESGDITSLTSRGGAGILDLNSNPACGISSDGTYSGDFSGYVTIDVVNYCTNFFPYEPSFYTLDAIATVGWNQAGGTLVGPNVLMGDIFFVDGAASGGNISGDPAVALEFDNRLRWSDPAGAAPDYQKTFYTRHYTVLDQGAPTQTGPAFAFIGDGREPLGLTYGMRYLWDGATTNPGLRTWALVFRSDYYAENFSSFGRYNLCDWYDIAIGAYDPDITNPAPYGFDSQSPRQVSVRIFDLDETEYTVSTGGPSGGSNPPSKKIYLETQRLVVTPNTDFIPGDTAFLNGGWVVLNFNQATAIGFKYWTAQAWVGVQHSGAGLAVSVGHAATLLNNQFLCIEAFPFDLGNVSN